MRKFGHRPGGGDARASALWGPPPNATLELAIELFAQLGSSPRREHRIVDSHLIELELDDAVENGDAEGRIGALDWSAANEQQRD